MITLQHLLIRIGLLINAFKSDQTFHFKVLALLLHESQSFHMTIDITLISNYLM